MYSSEQLGVSIGNVPLRLHIPEAELREKARLRYAQFLEEAQGGLPVFTTCAGATDDHGTGTSGHAGDFVYTWEDSSLRLNDTQAHFEGVRHEYGLDSLIRVLLSMLLARQRGFLLHAATVMNNGRAYVFTGKSGAGKSTIASLSPEGTVLTDEISLLKHVDGGWHAFGTPFWGEFRAEGANVHAPIAGLYFLSQASEDRVEKVSLRESIRAILPNVLFFSRELQVTQDLLCLLNEFASSVPCWRLFFRRKRSLWNVITA
ncbi:MAG TPA: hypothetical protein VKB26_03880 [Candidatus Acidoferrales bacterium]|nr:hypothetical protein [Candidatus Acidoferrales bacterium]